MSEIKDFPDWLKIKECKAVATFDINGKENGHLVDILNVNDSLMKSRKNKEFTQFYMSTVKRGGFKGLHAHPYKLDTIHCVFGKICVVIYPEVVEKDQIESAGFDINKFIVIEYGEGNHKTISFPAKYPHGYFGITEDAVLINYRDPAWDSSDVHQYSIRCDAILGILKKKYLERTEG
jgi:dTDP-4-dehydrorhamnose 3,5-epimerase-like enzyme